MEKKNFQSTSSTANNCVGQCRRRQWRSQLALSVLIRDSQECTTETSIHRRWKPLFMFWRVSAWSFSSTCRNLPRAMTKPSEVSAESRRTGRDGPRWQRNVLIRQGGSKTELWWSNLITNQQWPCEHWTFCLYPKALIATYQETGRLEWLK